MELSLSGRAVVLAVPEGTVIACATGTVWVTVERRRPCRPSKDVLLCAGQRCVVRDSGRVYLSAVGMASSTEVRATFRASSQIQVATRLTSSRGASSAGISQYELGLGAGVPARRTDTN